MGLLNGLPPPPVSLSVPTNTNTATSIAAPSVSSAAEPVSGSTVTAAQANITNDGLVENRVDNIVAANSPLMQRAADRANMQSNSRGMLNSSMAVGAAQGAVMDAAVPIAASDAASVNQFALSNQSATNSANQFNANNTQDANKFNSSQTQQNNQFNASNRQDINKFNASNTEAMSAAERVRLAGLATAANAAIAAENETFNRTRASIQADPNMTKESKDKAIRELEESHFAYMETFQALEDQGVTGLVDFGDSIEIGRAMNEWDDSIAKLKTNAISEFGAIVIGGDGTPWFGWGAEAEAKRKRYMAAVAALGPRPRY